MKLVTKVVNWIEEQVKNAKARGIVVGLSGGVDSSVAAVLCKGAVGDNLLGLIMPCHSNPEDTEDALMLSRKFGIQTERVDLTETIDKLIELYPSGEKIAQANIKPRLRMITLYYFANSLNYIVCGTGNKSEAIMGYFTKYGDGGADFLPLGGLLKTEVWQLAREIGIPERIIKKVPSAGLWEGQTDEAEMNITYKELDNILSKLEEDQEIKGEKVELIKRKMEQSKHKLSFPPIFQKGCKQFSGNAHLLNSILL